MTTEEMNIEPKVETSEGAALIAETQIGETKAYVLEQEGDQAKATVQEVFTEEPVEGKARMIISKVTVSFGHKINAGDFNSFELWGSMTADLHGDYDQISAMQEMFRQLRTEIKAQKSTIGLKKKGEPAKPQAQQPGKPEIRTTERVAGVRVVDQAKTDFD